MKKFRLSGLVVAVVICLFLSGCSAVMAARGTKDANLAVLREGTPRVIVLSELGEPKHSYDNTDIYEACKGDKSSLGRAFGHGILSFLSLGLWEAVGTPIEAASGSGKECFGVTVVYDANNKVKEVK